MPAVDNYGSAALAAISPLLRTRRDQIADDPGWRNDAERPKGAAWRAQPDESAPTSGAATWETRQQPRWGRHLGRPPVL